MKNKTFSLILVVLLFLVLTACENSKLITVPDVDNIISITITHGEESVTYDDRELITQAIANISNSKPTNKQSVQDIPQNDDFIQINMKLNQGTTILFVYKDGENYYIEQPYQGIYKVDSVLYDFFCSGRTIIQATE